MGMRKYSFELLNHALSGIGLPNMVYRKHADPLEASSLFGLVVLELGCQVVRETGDEPAKTFFVEYGAEHWSIDLNASYGSLPIDLATTGTCAEIKEATGHAQFGLITNYGTTEHFCPIETQRQAFKNIHDMCCEGGMMLHECPMAGYCRGHSPAHYHSDFFSRLATACGYEVVCNIRNGPQPNKMNTACVLRKTSHGFCSLGDFPLDRIEWKDGDGYGGMFYDHNKASH